MPANTTIDIPSSVTSIGDFAFSECSGVSQVTIPSSVTSIGGYAFWGCSGLDTLVAYWIEMWDIPVFTIPVSTVLSVPAGAKTAYQTKFPNNKIVERGIASYTIELIAGEGGMVGGGNSYVQFATCAVIAMAREGYTFVNWIENGVVVSRSESYTFQVTQDRSLHAVFVANTSANVDVSNVEIPADKGVAVEASADNAVIAWNAQTAAVSYTLVIKDATGANIICSLEFDGEGRLSALSFGAALRSAGNAFGFKVTNLEQNTTYSYTLQALDADNNVIETKQGEFTAKSGEQTAIPSIDAVPATIVGYYNLMGQRLNAEPTHGIYIILYSNGTSQKVFSSIQ